MDLQNFFLEEQRNLKLLLVSNVLNLNLEILKFSYWSFSVQCLIIFSLKFVFFRKPCSFLKIFLMFECIPQRSYSDKSVFDMLLVQHNAQNIQIVPFPYTRNHGNSQDRRGVGVKKEKPYWNLRKGIYSSAISIPQRYLRRSYFPCSKNIDYM